MVFYHAGTYQQGELGGRFDEFCFFQGCGFYEQVFFNGHMLRHMEAHLKYLYQSLSKFSLEYAKEPFEDIAVELLRQNMLIGKPGVVGIAYVAEAFDAKAFAFVWTQPWEVPGKAVRLCVYPRHQVSYLNSHKCISNMHLCLAQRYVAEQGYDDAVLTDPNGLALESLRGVLLFKDAKGFVATPREGRRPSVALERVMGVLSFRERTVALPELKKFKHAYVLSSVLGMQPVQSIGELEFDLDEASCELGNLAIL